MRFFEMQITVIISVTAHPLSDPLAPRCADVTCATRGLSADIAADGTWLQLMDWIELKSIGIFYPNQPVPLLRFFRTVSAKFSSLVISFSPFSVFSYRLFGDALHFSVPGPSPHLAYWDLIGFHFTLSFRIMIAGRYWPCSWPSAIANAPCPAYSSRLS